MERIDYFWKYVNKQETGCWLWTGSLSNGYGQFWTGTHNRRAHRWIYEHQNGPVDKALDLDHLCRVRNCVNPDHLEPVSRKENLLRGHTLTAAASSRKVCPRGHEYSHRDSRGHRRCKVCENAMRNERRKIYGRRS